MYRAHFSITLLTIIMLTSCGTQAPPPTLTVIPVTPTFTATEPPTAIPTAIDTSTPAPTRTPVLQSGNGSVLVTLVFKNNAKSPIDVYWVDFDGKEQKYFSVAPEKSAEQGTYSTHAWRVRDLAGNIVMDYVATDETRQTIEISADSVVAIELPPLPTLEPNLVIPVPIVGHHGCVVSTPPTNLNLDPFYAKYCDAGGIPIVASASVPDEALGHAWNIIMNLLAARPDLHAALVEHGQYFGVMGADEVTTDMPEYRHLKNDPVTDWDQRARGLGGIPFSSGAEENLLCYGNDRYLGESIALHEFAHTIDGGFDFIDPQFDKYLALTYASAMEKDLWKNTYAATNQDEYWAEGVQDYFNTNLSASPANGIHNEINTRKELSEYDPELWALINYIFRGFDWSPDCSNQ